MQATAKTDGTTMVITDDNDSEYVGKHRPHRMSLLHPRVRVGRLSGRTASPK